MSPSAQLKKGEPGPLTVPWGFAAQLEARPPPGCGWFSVADMLRRTAYSLGLFYYSLATQPLTFSRFALQYNRLWFGGAAGTAMTLLLPATPVLLAAVAWGKRLRDYLLPQPGDDWKMAGPGRIWFLPPPSTLASIVYDALTPLADYVAAFVLFGDDPDGVEHTWYDAICKKEYWCGLLDAADARRPLQLGAWDGAALHDVSRGVESGGCDLVCKISDSYLGIGDRVFKRGVDFVTRGEVEDVLRADPLYAGKPAVLCEIVSPSASLEVSSDGYGPVHSLDILTLRTGEGAKVLSVVLWTDCTTWSSHSAAAGYLVDVETETIVAPTAWYAPYFASMQAPLVGQRVPGAREACLKAMAAHDASELEWLTCVGWDAMITDEGPTFFEGNVAAYRTPRRMALSLSLADGFRSWMATRGKRSAAA